MNATATQYEKQSNKFITGAVLVILTFILIGFIFG